MKNILLQYHFKVRVVVDSTFNWPQMQKFILQNGRRASSLSHATLKMSLTNAKCLFIMIIWHTNSHRPVE